MYTCVCACVCACVRVPYSRLFSLGARISQMGSLLMKIYSGLLACMKFDCGSLLQKLVRTQLCPDGL